MNYFFLDLFRSLPSFLIKYNMKNIFVVFKADARDIKPYLLYFSL